MEECKPGFTFEKYQSLHKNMPQIIAAMGRITSMCSHCFEGTQCFYKETHGISVNSSVCKGIDLWEGWVQGHQTGWEEFIRLR